MSDLDLDAIAARADAATEGPWHFAIAPHPDNPETKAEYVTSALRDEDSPLWVTWVADPEGGPDDYLIPALTGDGPTSQANAEFIAHARADVPALVAEIERLRAEAVRCAEEYRLRRGRPATELVERMERYEKWVADLNDEIVHHLDDAKNAPTVGEQWQHTKNAHLLQRVRRSLHAAMTNQKESDGVR